MKKYKIINLGNKYKGLNGCYLNSEGFAWFDSKNDNLKPHYFWEENIIKTLWLQYCIFLLSGQKTEREEVESDGSR